MEAVGKRVSKPVVKLDRDRLVAEYGRAVADDMIAKAEQGEAVETRPAAEKPEKRKK